MPGLGMPAFSQCEERRNGGSVVIAPCSRNGVLEGVTPAAKGNTWLIRVNSQPGYLFRVENIDIVRATFAALSTALRAAFESCQAFQ